MSNDSDPAIAKALQRLADYRTNDTRASQETFDNGVIILENNAANNLGDEGELAVQI
jgi:ER membrane protein complex subunit 2